MSEIYVMFYYDYTNIFYSFILQTLIHRLSKTYQWALLLIFFSASNIVGVYSIEQTFEKG